jgi:hypothetical protein
MLDESSFAKLAGGSIKDVVRRCEQLRGIVLTFCAINQGELPMRESWQRGS